MKDLATKVIKKVTLEVIYEAVEDRTKEIKADIREIKEDLRYLNQKVDTQIGQLRQEIGQLSQKVDTQIGQLNQRFDTVMQMLVDIARGQGGKGYSRYNLGVASTEEIEEEKKKK